jgi:hypothetical protein
VACTDGGKDPVMRAMVLEGGGIPEPGGRRIA